MSQLTEWLGEIEVRVVPIPHDCRDGFLGAFWRRPEAYLDRAIRNGISTFAMLSDVVIERGLKRLSEDLRSGRWEERYGHLRKQDSADLGYRLVIAHLAAEKHGCN
jgi:hypothetical protein